MYFEEFCLIKFNLIFLKNFVYLLYVRDVLSVRDIKLNKVL